MGPDSEDELQESGVYWQLLTSRPGEIAAASAGNTQRIKKMLIKFSIQEPKNCIAIPNDICQIEGGGLSTSGGKFNIKF